MSRQDEDECGVARQCGPAARGGAWQTRGVDAGAALDESGQGPLKRARDVRTDIYLASYLPFVVFLVLLVLFTVWYKSMPVVPWFAVLLFADLLLVGAYPQRATAGFKERNRYDWFPLICGILALGAGISLGIQNSTIIEPWMHAHYLRTYGNVAPGADPKMYVDAGILHFATGTKVDAGSAAGYLSWPHTYCAAPIVAEGGSDLRVGFWAIGVDCCSPHGDFTCDDAGNSDVKSGLRIESHHLGESAAGASNFDLAVRKAAAFYGKEISGMPVFVVWQGDPAKMARNHLIAAVCFILVFAAIGGISSLVSRKLLLQVDQQRQLIDRTEQQGSRLPQFGTGV